MMRAAIHGSAILLAAAAFAAGCGGPAPSTAHPGGSTSARSAVTDAERRVQCGKPWRQRSVRLPAGFVAEAAVMCVPAMVNVVHGRGHPVFAERVADRGLAPLVAALRRPPARPSPGLFCEAQLVTVPPLFLIGREGQIVRPVIPTSGCGQPQPQVLAALQHVPWVTVHASAQP